VNSSIGHLNRHVWETLDRWGGRLLVRRNGDVTIIDGPSVQSVATRRAWFQPFSVSSIFARS
jgi:hypothetical protein